MKQVMMGLSKLMAALGGIVLSFLIVLTCVSIAGRLLNGLFHGSFMQSIAPGFSDWAIGAGVGPVNGDYELVEAGVAFAIFAFIPLCQITSSHASVDLFADFFPDWLDRLLRMLTEIVFAGVLILIAWRLYDGMISKQRYMETSFLLQFPVWWAYAASLFGAVVSALVSCYVALVRIYEFFTRRRVLDNGVETN
ncbi:MAG: C4-dicarboxylate ABC transporter permease [Pseudooceanicola sp.]|jgi:TRAP-type C4-dicarboxylate transport system permease small subunit|nr:C4-dicarboxylate ABC transporter permease [Pseudooceanicola sp.]|tara:strand:+ start:8878 stop:9459 length:582 start_codon:yes stop_codon:yes gene_type:complete